MVDRIEQTYIRRFGSMRQAYALIGYKEFRNMPAVRETKLRTRKTLRAVFRQILRTFKGQVEAIQERGGNQQALKDVYLLRRIDSSCKTVFLTKENDPWLKKGKRIRDLSLLRKMLDRMNLVSPNLLVSAELPH
jgi:hypothetical protein